MLALLHNFHLDMKACLVLDLGIAIILYADEWRHEGEGNLFLKIGVYERHLRAGKFHKLYIDRNSFCSVNPRV